MDFPARPPMQNVSPLPPIAAPAAKKSSRGVPPAPPNPPRLDSAPYSPSPAHSPADPGSVQSAPSPAPPTAKKRSAPIHALRPPPAAPAGFRDMRSPPAAIPSPVNHTPGAPPPHQYPPPRAHPPSAAQHGYSKNCKAYPRRYRRRAHIHPPSPQRRSSPP